MAQMSVYADKQRYNFIICIVESEVKNKKEYDVIISPMESMYTEESIEKIIDNLCLFLKFLRIPKSSIKFFLKKNEEVFEIEFLHVRNIVKIKKYLDTFGALKFGVLHVYEILKDKTNIEVFKLSEIEKSISI